MTTSIKDNYYCELTEFFIKLTNRPSDIILIIGLAIRVDPQLKLCVLVHIYMLSTEISLRNTLKTAFCLANRVLEYTQTTHSLCVLAHMHTLVISLRNLTEKECKTNVILF